MDLEEERLRQQIEAREIALKQKIDALKERVEHFTRMIDVKSQVRQRPGLMLTGSILAGFLAKRFVGRKNRYAPYPNRSHSRPMRTSGATAGAIISAIGTRVAVAVIGEVVGKLLPGKLDSRQPLRSASTSTNCQPSSGN
jgi:hypothetical protein